MSHPRHESKARIATPPPGFPPALPFGLPLLFLLALAGPARAQVASEHHSSPAQFASRGSLPATSDGWAFERFAIDRQGGGIGAVGILGFGSLLQDQDCALPATYQLALFEQVPSNSGGPVLPGSLASVPDPSRVLAQTAAFLAPAGTGACAWRFQVRVPPPGVPGCRPLDLFVGAFLQGSPGGPADQVSALISLASGELANATSTPATRAEIDAEFASTMLGGTLGTTGPNPATLAVPAPARIHHFFLVHEHLTRTGVVLAGSLDPRFGWAGDYPDAADVVASSPARRDELAWEGNHSLLGGPSVRGLLLLATRLVRDLPAPGLGQAIGLGATGCLELDPSDPLFASTLAGSFPDWPSPGSTSVRTRTSRHPASRASAECRVGCTTSASTSTRRSCASTWRPAPPRSARSTPTRSGAEARGAERRARPAQSPRSSASNASQNRSRSAGRV